MEKEKRITKSNKNPKQVDNNVNYMNNYNPSDIFELLKDLNFYNTNKEIISYFKFAKFYGLLDVEKSSALHEAEESLRKSDKITIFGSSISIFSTIFLYKRNYYNFSYLVLCMTAFPILYFRYNIKKEANFQLLKLKDDYFYQLERFFKEEKNPLILNPNFLVEEIVDPDLKLYQNICRLNLLK